MSQADLPPDPSDSTMDELNAIREHIGGIVADMTIEERIGWYHEQAQAAAALIGKVLVPHPDLPNALIMESIAEALPGRQA